EDRRAPHTAVRSDELAVSAGDRTVGRLAGGELRQVEAAVLVPIPWPAGNPTTPFEHQHLEPGAYQRVRDHRAAEARADDDRVVPSRLHRRGHGPGLYRRARALLAPNAAAPVHRHRCAG